MSFKSADVITKKAKADSSSRKRVRKKVDLKYKLELFLPDIGSIVEFSQCMCGAKDYSDT